MELLSEKPSKNLINKNNRYKLFLRTFQFRRSFALKFVFPLRIYFSKLFLKKKFELSELKDIVTFPVLIG